MGAEWKKKKKKRKKKRKKKETGWMFLKAAVFPGVLADFQCKKG